MLEQEIAEESPVVLATWEVILNSLDQVPTEVAHVIDEFKDIFPNDLPD